MFFATKSTPNTILSRLFVMHAQMFLDFPSFNFHRSLLPPKKRRDIGKRCPSHVDAYCLFSCFAFGFVLLCLSLRYALVVGSVCFVDDGVDLVDVVT